MKKAIKLACAACALALTTLHMPALCESAPAQAQAEQDEKLSDSQVKRYQQILIDLGYLKGRADGIFGKRSTAAATEFQADNGLEETGALDGATRAALDAQAQSAASVEAAQQRLIELGYLRGKADGVFGERSRAAVRLFQAMNGVEATGRIDEATTQKLFSDDVRTLPTRLTGGDKNERVTDLQQRLIRYGFLAGRADGTYGTQTEAAVKRLQRHLIAQGVDENLGIEPTGEATPATLALFYDDGFSAYVADIAPGDEGAEVLRAEQRLATLGYMDLAADEVFDDYAVTCAQAFILRAGIEATVLDKAAIDALYAEDAPAADAYVPHDIALGDRGEAVRSAERALVRAGMTSKLPNGRYDDELSEAVTRMGDYLASAGSPAANLFGDPNALSIAAQQVLGEASFDGARDIDADSAEADILRLQRRLYTLYYVSKGSVDGKFGERTANALIEFQKANGLPETGVGDAETRQALFSDDAVENRRPYRVEVDISRQRVYVFELRDDGEYEQTHEFICSTGVGNSTPRGVFLNGFPANYWHHFEKFDCWAKYSFEIEGDIMFHSVIFNANDESTVRMNSVYALGSKASHGCIRLKVEDAKWLFEHCKRGKLIIVIY